MHLITVLMSLILAVPAWAEPTDCNHQLQDLSTPIEQQTKPDNPVDRREHDALYAALTGNRIHAQKLKAETVAVLQHEFAMKDQSYAQHLSDKMIGANYFTKYEQSRHKIHVKDGLIYDSENKVVDQKVATIYIMDENLEIYIFQEKFLAPGRVGTQISHAHLARGLRITGAGEVRVSKGVLTHANNNSGHYSPEGPFLAQFKQVLDSQLANLSRAQFTAYLQGPPVLNASGVTVLEIPKPISLEFTRKEADDFVRHQELNRIMAILVIPPHERTEIETDYLEDVPKKLRYEARDILRNYKIKNYAH